MPNKTATISEHRLHESDTGSPEVQVAIRIGNARDDEDVYLAGIDAPGFGRARLQAFDAADGLGNGLPRQRG